MVIKNERSEVFPEFQAVTRSRESMEDSSVQWSEVDSRGGDRLRDCRDIMNGCGLQFSSMEVARTTSTEVDSQRDCVCYALQANSQRDHSNKERTYEKVEQFHQSFLLPKLQYKFISRLQPLLVLALFLSIFQCGLSQESDSIPERCYTDTTTCVFSLDVQYRYNGGDCEQILCAPPPNGHGFNSFMTLAECESMCMQMPTTTVSPIACYRDWVDVDGCSPAFPTTRYSYQSLSDECVDYHSFNCEPDGIINSFKTLQQCEQLCLTPITTTPTPVTTAPTPVTTTPTPVTTAPTLTGSGDNAFQFTTPSQDITSDDSNEIISTQDLITPTSITTSIATSTVDRTTPTQRLNIYDHAIIGVGLLALFMCVTLVLIIVVVMFKYRRRLALNKQEVMDSRRVKIAQAYRGKTVLFSHNSLTASVQTRGSFSTVSTV